MSTSVPKRSLGYGLLLFALVLAESASAFETAMVFVAIPHLMNEYQVDSAYAGWLVTAFYLTAAISAGICGRLGDIFGRKRMVVVLLLISGVGSLISLIGDSMAMVIAGRGIQGVAGAVMPLAIALARSVAPPGKANSAIGAVAATAVVAAAGGALISGLLIDLSSWHAIFVFSAILAVAAALGVQFFIPKDEIAPSVARQPIDWVGAALLTVAIGSTLFGITNGTKQGWGSPIILITIIGGLILLVMFVLYELRVPSPLIQPRLFTHRHMALTLLATVFMAGIMGGLGALISIVQQSPTTMPLGLGLNATEAGLMTGGAALAAYLLTPMLGRVSRMYGGRVTLMLGAVIALVYLGSFALLFDSLLGFIVVSVIGAVCTLFIYGSLPILVAESTPEARMGEVTGAQVVLRTAMTSVASAVTTTVLASSVVPGTTMPDQTGMYRNLAVVAVWTIPLLVVAFVLKKRTIDEDPHPSESSMDAPHAATSADSSCDGVAADATPQELFEDRTQ